MGLVPLQTTDELTIYRWLNDPRVRTRAGRPGWKACYSLEQAQDLIRERLGQRTRFDLLVVDLAREEPVGLVELDHLHAMSDSARISVVWGGKEGEEMIEEALRLGVGFGFNSQALHRLWARVPCVDRILLRAFQQVGFKVEGVLREDHFSGGVWRDSTLLSLLSAEARPC